jgi:hypothetical protein
MFHHVVAVSPAIVMLPGGYFQLRCDLTRSDKNSSGGERRDHFAIGRNIEAGEIGIPSSRRGGTGQIWKQRFSESWVLSLDMQLLG